MYQKAFNFSKNIPFLGINDDDDDDYIVEYLTGHRISHAHITPARLVTASLSAGTGLTREQKKKGEIVNCQRLD